MAEFMIEEMPAVRAFHEILAPRITRIGEPE